jgi:galactokinase
MWVSIVEGILFYHLNCRMDQTISVMGKPRTAMMIHFWPESKVVPVLIPKSISTVPAFVFLVANTLVVSEKQATAPFRYNLRVVETRIAAALLSKALNLKVDFQGITLHHVLQAYKSSQGVEKTEDEWLFVMSQLAEKHLPKDGLNLPQAADILGMNVRRDESIHV